MYKKALKMHRLKKNHNKCFSLTVLLSNRDIMYWREIDDKSKAIILAEFITLLSKKRAITFIAVSVYKDVYIFRLLSNERNF